MTSSDESLESAKKKARATASVAGVAAAIAASPAASPDVYPRFTAEQLLATHGAEESIPDWDSPALGRKASAMRRTRFASFPEYLVVTLQRYEYGLDASGTYGRKKRMVRVSMPPELDLAALRGAGPQAGENVVGGDAAAGASGAGGAGGGDDVESEVANICQMGFTANAARRALAALGAGRGGVQEAMMWLLDHSGDAGINDPLPGEEEPFKVDHLVGKVSVFYVPLPITRIVLTV